MTNKTTVLLGLTCAMLLGTAACSTAERDTREPGRYEKKSSYMDNDGTTYENHKTTDITTDSNGNRHKSVKSKTTKDPKGLFNKKTTEEYNQDTNPQ